MIDIDKLQTFLAVCEERNLTRAAARRFMTPASASAQIRKLEEQLQLPLFLRSSRGMELTPQGERLRSEIQAVIKAGQELLAAASRLRGAPSGRIRLGLNASPRLLGVGALAECLRLHAPAVSLECRSGSSREVVAALSAPDPRDLDAGFVCSTPEGRMEFPGLGMLELQELQLVVAGHPEWRQRLGIGDWERLADLDWISSGGWCPFEEAAQRELARRGLPCRSAPHSGDDRTKSELAEAGLGLAVLEESEALERERAGALAVWRPGPLTCNLSLAWPQANGGDPALGSLLHCAERIWGARTP